MFHGGQIVDVDQGRSVQLTADRPVAADGKIYFASKGTAQAYDLQDLQTVETKDKRGNPITIQVPKLIWRLADQPVMKVHVKAGNRLYAHHERTILAIDLPSSDNPAWNGCRNGIIPITQRHLQDLEGCDALAINSEWT